MIRSFLLVCLATLSACTLSTPPKQSVYEVTGSSIERIEGVSKILAQNTPPPTAMLDARFVEEKKGDGVLGPSDYRAFYFIKVAPQEIEQWTAKLTQLSTTASYQEPKLAYDWWIPQSTFSALEFYKPETLTSRRNGWIGVEQKTGHIYIFTFTM